MLPVALLLLSSLIGQSHGYMRPSMAASGVSGMSNTPTTLGKLPAAGSDWNGQFAASLNDRGGGGGSSLLGASGSRGRLFRTVTTLRGGSPAMNLPGYDAVKSALAGISVPAIAWTGGPALFAQVQ